MLPQTSPKAMMTCHLWDRLIPEMRSLLVQWRSDFILANYYLFSLPKDVLWFGALW